MTAMEQDLVAFAQQLVATPSLPGEERRVAALVSSKLVGLGFRDVAVDEVGNVVGSFGSEPPRLMFNGHLDHVPPAGMDDPYGAQLVDGHLRGRGSLDMKANIAAGMIRLCYAVLERSTGNDVGSVTLDDEPGMGGVITVGLDRWIITASKRFPTGDLVDGILYVEQHTREAA